MSYAKTNPQPAGLQPGETAASVERIGMRPVCRMSFGGISFACGADPAHRIYSHNLTK